jgi:acetylornithine/N-succinyldiaminopimelate aminotransferase
MPTLRQSFLQFNAQTSEMPLLIEVERAEGVYLYGPNGERYLDLISGIGVSNLGHSHPKVVKAIQTQAEKYLHLMVYGEFVQSPQVLLAKKLSNHLPSSLNQIYLCNSGAEAIEGAMKLAKRVTSRGKIIACHHSYHGSTQGALSLMGNEYYKAAYRPLIPGIEFIEFGNKEHLSKITSEHAAIFMEAVQGEAGIRLADISYWQALREKCDETGCLLVLDEIQTGMGRTGKMFGFQYLQIEPDVLVLAKALGAGLPIGAFISSRERMSSLAHNPILGHITTFGGHPLSCAAALAGLEVLEDEDFIQSVSAKHELFIQLLKHPAILEVRGIGLMLAVQLRDFDFNKKVIDRCIEKGVMVDWFLHCSDAMRIAPPLSITAEEIQYACKVILDSLND